MRFRRSAPAILITASVLVIAALTAVGSALTARLLQGSKESAYHLMRDVLASNLKSSEELALTRAEIIASMPAIKSAFAARDRDRLLAECGAMFALQSEKYGVSRAELHSPTAPFLSLDKGSRGGVPTTNAMVLDVNRNKVLQKGVVIGPSGPEIMGAVPVTGDGASHLGSFAIGLEFAPMLDRIKQASDVEAAVFIEERMLRDAGSPPAQPSSTSRIGRFVRLHTTHPDLAAALLAEGELEINEPRTYERSALGSLWGVQLVPLYDYSNKKIGVFALIIDFGDAKRAAGRARVWQLLAALFGVVLLAGAVLVVVRGVLLAPVAALSHRFTALAGGDASQRAEPDHTYCEELRQLAASYERLRVERDRP